MKKSGVFSFFCVLFFYSFSGAYFENIPLGFKAFSSGGGFLFRNPASFGEKRIDFDFQKPFQGIDENFSSQFLGAGYPFGKIFVGLKFRQFFFDSVYAETLAEISSAGKMKNFNFGLRLKSYKIAIKTDEYTADDTYLSKTSAGAYDFDFGFLKIIGNAEFSLIVANVLGSGIGIRSDEKLNRAISVGVRRKVGFFGKENAAFLEIVKNTKENYESFDYYLGNFCSVTRKFKIGFALGRYYFTPSLVFADKFFAKSVFEVSAGYRYPHGTDPDFGQLAFGVAVLWK
ncbi:MAG: hypothetical protein J7L54_02315 [Elusimicrobia bacterium]|nr:hypothetical protein [Elusimicrobiota bacterium]